MGGLIISTASLSRQRARARRRDIIIEAATPAGLVCARGERQCDGHARSRLPVNDHGESKREDGITPSSLLKKVFEVSRSATLIQDPSARRTKDSQPSGFGFECCALPVRFRVFQQTARPRIAPASPPTQLDALGRTEEAKALR